jgi:regulator of protease activity HflC (stomatin/prohibitin superfamily)
MFKIITVAIAERAIVFRHGLPFRALGPGRHVVWGFGLAVRRWSTDPIVFDMPAEIRTLLPADAFGEVTIATAERAVLFHDGRPKKFLGPGTHRYWELDDTVRVQLFSVHDAMPELSAELAAIIPRTEYVDAIIRAHERGLFYVQGRLVRTLEPGRYAFWSPREMPVEIRAVDSRLAQLTLAGQELMTRDKVTLRLTLTVEYAIEDPALATHAVADVKDAVYLVVQLAARQFVSGVTLDELLAGRDAMTRFLEEDAAEKAGRFGVRVARAGVKDIVLPGEMKTLLNKVIEAEKEAAANVILRREETAATRSLANTAKLMSEQPLLLRLKELESLKEIASRIDKLQLVVGTQGVSPLLPTGLLTGETPET